MSTNETSFESLLSELRLQDDAEAIVRALRGDSAGLERLFEDRAVRRKNWPFTAYDDKLRSTAESVRNS
jgi:hypothetical protein